MFRLLLLSFCAASLLLTACGRYNDLPPGTSRILEASPVLEQQQVVVEQGTATAPDRDYRLGPGDVLFINVNGRPELGSPVTDRSADLSGSRIDGTGAVHLPLVGAVSLAGSTIREAQQRLKMAFAHYLNDPWVVVEVTDYRSQPLYLIGQFRSAGTYYMDRPLTLLQGVALGGGLLDTANLRSARLVRDGQIVPVDIARLLREGDAEQNSWLASGDTLYVPDDKNLNVFVFGAVKKPGPVSMPNGRLTLSQALSSAGLNGSRDNQKKLRIIRSHSTTRGELLVLDLGRVLRGEVLPYLLQEGDIIYVPHSAIGSWNQALGELLPSLQTVSALLQPFVQVQYLKEN